MVILRALTIFCILFMTGVAFTAQVAASPSKSKQCLVPADCGEQEPNALNPPLWFPVFIHDKVWEQQCRDRIKSNYTGPALEGINELAELSEFVVKADGTVTWIYHPCRYGEHISPEITRAIDRAVRQSSPLPACPKSDCNISGISTYCLIYDPKVKDPVFCFCFSDHPSQTSVEISTNELKKWEANRWAKINCEEVAKNFAFSKTRDDKASAAYWVCLNPDGTIEKLKPVRVSTGSKINHPAAKKIERELGLALSNTQL
ncbi:MAG: hypothetical protein K2X81_06280, partial [Candidatus Obscuribacterales bacterium]|nr:hypothetical protein [Candidatus Obscuribacterales bacterium]